MANERELIERIAARVGIRGGVVTGVGDDAAVLADGTVLALDMLVDGVHVRRATHSPADIGHKALAVNLSDIAAMGADPVAALVGLGVPPDLSADDVDAMYEAMEELAMRHGMAIVGGDITEAPVLTLAVCITGHTRPGVAPVLRSGGCAGDLLVITGPLGAAACGLMLLDDTLLGTGVPTADALIAAHRRPTPLIAHGHRLADAGAHAMMDISDGLLLDAQRLGVASGLHAEVDLSAVPRAEGVDQVAAAAGRDAAMLAATGGEDYQLLAAMPPNAALPRDVVVVGLLRAGTPGVSAVVRGRDVTPAHLGWEHGRR